MLVCLDQDDALKWQGVVASMPKSPFATGRWASSIDWMLGVGLGVAVAVGVGVGDPSSTVHINA